MRTADQIWLVQPFGVKTLRRRKGRAVDSGGAR